MVSNDLIACIPHLNVQKESSAEANVIMRVVNPATIDESIEQQWMLKGWTRAQMYGQDFLGNTSKEISNEKNDRGLLI